MHPVHLSTLLAHIASASWGLVSAVASDFRLFLKSSPSRKYLAGSWAWCSASRLCSNWEHWYDTCGKPAQVCGHSSWRTPSQADCWEQVDPSAIAGKANQLKPEASNVPLSFSAVCLLLERIFPCRPQKSGGLGLQGEMQQNFGLYIQGHPARGYWNCFIRQISWKFRILAVYHAVIAGQLW